MPRDGHRNKAQFRKRTRQESRAERAIRKLREELHRQQAQRHLEDEEQYFNLPDSEDRDAVDGE